MDPMDEDVRLAVKRGLQWLDTNHPAWVESIDLDLFDIGAPNSCVIGQLLSNDYPNMTYQEIIGHEASKAGLSFEEGNDWAVEHGFQPPLYFKISLKSDEPAETDFSKISEYYRLLDDEWKAKITSRQGS